MKQLMLGNAAVARGLYEAGCCVVSSYPGTPSTEITEEAAKFDDIYCEWAPNEKVATETACGASIGGARSFCAMKHVGVNVAADPLFTAAYVGLPGGFVLVSADDPLCHSSQDEQDNRTYARFMGMPCFEPATAQEAKDMTREALLLAREPQQPVMLRTTTRVNHLRGPVTFGALGEPAPIVPFERNPMRFVPVPAVAQGRHKVLVEHLENARAKAEASPWNKVSGEGRIGVIASGISRAYLADALAENGWEKDVKVLELGFTWPLPENLLESELFGHVKGAFTGAVASRRGLLEEARGGTVFLDEVGEISPAMQLKLLHAVQEKEVRPVGSNRAVRIDARFICATNRNLRQCVAEGSFRKDLYYRLAVIPVTLPPLRERADDIPLLAQYFMARFADKNNKKIKGFTPGAMDRLVRYAWPGNVRELENVIERASILLLGEHISERELPERFAPARGDALTDALTTDCPTLEDVERAVILKTLKRFGGNKTEAAKALGITRKTLHAKLSKYQSAQEDAPEGEDEDKGAATS